MPAGFCSGGRLIGPEFHPLTARFAKCTTQSIRPSTRPGNILHQVLHLSYAFSILPDYILVNIEVGQIAGIHSAHSHSD